jgi:two-component system NarL family response regulator
MEKIRVMLVDDHEIVRRGLVSMFQLDPEFEIVGEASSGEEAILKAQSIRPDVIVLDLKVGSSNGSQICHDILATTPQAKVMILTAFIDEEAIFECLSAGAKGYVLKDADAMRLLDQVKAVSRGEEVLDRRVLGILVNRFRDLNKRESRRMLLTPQEITIVKYVSEGLTNKQIAQKMILSDNTIKRHLQDIMNKLGVNNRAELVNRAMRENLI